MTSGKKFAIAAILFCIFMAAKEAGLTPNLLTPKDVTQATYVYDDDDGNVPAEVDAALTEISDDTDIVATPFDKDQVNGEGDTPTQYRVALAAAKEVGLPALVIQSGDEVIRVIEAPTTRDQVMEAIE
jgi:hypothetical protein